MTGLLTGLLAVAFVLTGLRRETGFIVVEAWQLVTAMCFAAWGAEIVWNRRFTLELDEIGLFALAVVAAAWVSYFGALDVPTWFKRASRITCLFGMYLFLVTHIRDEKTFRTFVRWCLTACTVAALTMLVQVGQWIGAGAPLDTLLGGGFAGTFANGNQGSTYVATFVVLVLALRHGPEPFLPSPADAAALVICAVAVVVDQSRTGLLVLLLGATIVFVGQKRIGYWIGMMTSAGVWFWIMSGHSHLVSRWLAMFGASGDPQLDAFVRGGTVVRSFLVRIYWTIIKAHPVFGIGAANYGFMARLRLDWPPVPAGAAQGFDTLDRYLGFSSHNGLLNWWAETGTVGFVPLVGSLVYATWALGLVHLRRTVPARRSSLALGTLAAIGAFVVTNMTGDFGVYETRYWTLLATATIVLRLSQPDRAGYSLLQVGQRPVDRVRPPDKYLFYCYDAHRGQSAPVTQETAYSSRLWTPTVRDAIPPRAKRYPFLALWAMHHLSVFSNRDYGVFVVHDGALLVHHSCVFPRFFRFPFMESDDLHIGYTWTHPDYRGKGLATFANRRIVEIDWTPGRTFWYVVREDNISSIRAAERAGFVCVGSGIRTKRLGLRALGAFVMNGVE